jgi:hypothetical protein
MSDTMTKKQHNELSVQAAVEEEEEVKRVYYKRRMKSRPPTKEAGIRVIRYSEASYALLGDTLSYKELIAAAGCKFNSSLRDPVNGAIVPGWVCRCVKKDAIVDMLKKAGAVYTVIEV